MAKPRTPKPTPAELELLRTLWQLGPSTVKQVHEARTLGRYTLEMKPPLVNFLLEAVDFFEGLGLPINADQLLEASAGINGLTRTPTAQAFNLHVFWGMADSSGVRSCNGSNCNSEFAAEIFSPFVDRHGNLVIERYRLAVKRGNHARRVVFWPRRSWTLSRFSRLRGRLLRRTRTTGRERTSHGYRQNHLIFHGSA